MPHPHGPACTCPPLPPDAGLLAHTITCDHHAELAATLARIAAAPSTATLRVLTADPEPPAGLVSLPADAKRCDGTLTCPCDACGRDRAECVKRGVRASEPIPIRRRRIAA